MFNPERLRQRRLDMGLTLEEVGAPLGISRSAVNKYERGVIKNVYTSVVEGFASVLRCSPGYLMGWTDDPLAGVTSAAPAALSPQLQALADALDQLNEEGQEKLLDYAADLVAGGRYKKSRISVFGQKNMAAARSGDRIEVASVSAGEEDAVLPVPSDNLDI